VSLGKTAPLTTIIGVYSCFAPPQLYAIVLLGGEGKPLTCKVIEDELLPTRDVG